MSTANRTPPTIDPLDALAQLAGHVKNAVQAIAFWTAALLPLVLMGGLFAGVVDQHLDLVGGAIALNAVCALVGHGHSPN